MRGAWSVDGYGTLEPNPRSVTVAESGTPAPNGPPPANGVFPVDVTIICATPGAVIHYTIDGPAADESSPVYGAGCD